MIPYISSTAKVLKGKFRDIPSYINKSQDENIDWITVESFGEEWERFNNFTEEEIRQVGEDYFDILPSHLLNKDSKVLDVGCGTGRWTSYLSDKVGFIDAIDPSKAVFMADKLLASNSNVRITQASVDGIPFPNESYDLVFSLGVLHHIPDTLGAMKKSVEKVRKDGYFLVYLYYSLDNRGIIFKSLFLASNAIRNVVFRLPQKIKNIVTDCLAIFFYMPFVLLAKAVEEIPYLKKGVNKIPLSYYRDKSFKIIRNDALDRFGTRLEQRFSKKEIEHMMLQCGLVDIQFSNKEPYWHAIGRKK